MIRKSEDFYIGLKKKIGFNFRKKILQHIFFLFFGCSLDDQNKHIGDKPILQTDCLQVSENFQKKCSVFWKVQGSNECLEKTDQIKLLLQDFLVQHFNIFFFD